MVRLGAGVIRVEQLRSNELPTGGTNLVGLNGQSPSSKALYLMLVCGAVKTTPPCINDGIWQQLYCGQCGWKIPGFILITSGIGPIKQLCPNCHQKNEEKKAADEKARKAALKTMEDSG